MKKFRWMKRMFAVMFSVLTIMQMGSLYVYVAETEEVGETQGLFQVSVPARIKNQRMRKALPILKV